MVGITPLGWAWFKGLNGSGQRTSGRSTTLKPGDVMEDGTVYPASLRLLRDEYFEDRRNTNA